MSQFENDFNFNGQKSSEERLKNAEIKQKKNEKFFRIAQNSVIALAFVAVIGGGATWAYSSYQNSINEKVATAVSSVEKTDQNKTIGLVNRELQVLENTFAKNKLLINNFGQYKDLIEVMAMGGQLGAFQTQNSRIYKSVGDSLNADKTSLLNTYNVAKSSDRSLKVNTLVDDTKAMTNLKKWDTAVQNNTFLYVGGILQLNKDIQSRLDFVKATQDDIVRDVQERLKNKDYNLDLAQSRFNDEITKEGQEEIEDLKQARLELLDTEDALRQEGESTSRVSSLLSDTDVANASTAMSDLTKEAMLVVSEDKLKVEQLIAQASVNGGTLPAPQAKPEGSTTPASTTTVVNSGPSFLDYYLLYSFMNMGSNSSSFNNGYNSGLAAANNNNTRSAVMTGAAKPYSIKNEASHVNKTLTQKADMSGKSFANQMGIGASKREALNTTRNQISAARTKATQVRSTRQSELSRMGYTNTQSGATSRGNKSSIAASRGVKSVSSSSASSSRSSSSFSGRSGGFSGGG